MWLPSRCTARGQSRHGSPIARNRAAANAVSAIRASAPAGAAIKQRDHIWQFPAIRVASSDLRSHDTRFERDIVARPHDVGPDDDGEGGPGVEGWPTTEELGEPLLRGHVS